VKTDTLGNIQRSFDPEDPELRDLTWDGEYLWGMRTTGEIVKYDTLGNLIESIDGLLSGSGWGITWADSALWVSDPEQDMIYLISLVPEGTVAEDPEPRRRTWKLELSQNQPNPFSRKTTIGFTVPGANPGDVADISVAVYDVSGRFVSSLFHGQLPAGIHHVTWNGRDDAGQMVSTGIYFCQVRSAGEERGRRMVLLR